MARWTAHRQTWRSRARRGGRPPTTAYGNRAAQILLNINTRWSDPGAADPHVSWTRSLWEDLHRLASGVYVNFLGEEGTDRVRQAYGEQKYARAWSPSSGSGTRQTCSG